MYVPELSVLTYLILAAAAFFGGWVDSIAGGGGMITVPALLSVGLPPHFALGTNKLQASFGSFTAATNYASRGLVPVKRVVAGILFTASGSVLGTLAIQSISASFLERLLPVMLLVIFIYMLVSPELGSKDTTRRLNAGIFYFLFGTAIGFYDGFFGPGTGSFWTVAFVILLGLNLKSATAHTKVMNFTSNIVSLAAFIPGGHVLFGVGLVMGVCQALGARIGSAMVIHYRVRFVRVMFTLVVGATIVKLLVSQYF
ncbi:TSUP family transporter [bacterium]|nr:TSUP family transporter [candidate division CSSED10-310 bacterium]